MEAKMESITYTLKAMQDLVQKKGIFDDKQSHGKKTKDKMKKRKTGEEDRCDSSMLTNSDTTIYQNVLKEASSEVQDMMSVDNEITFYSPDKVRRGSSFSDDQVNTSDEVMEIDCDKFIAECQAEAERSRHQSQEGHENKEVSHREQMV